MGKINPFLLTKLNQKVNMDNAHLDDFKYNISIFNELNVQRNLNALWHKVSFEYWL